MAFVLAFAVLSTSAVEAKTRKLKLYYLHTGEKAEIAYKKDGKYLKGGLKKINRFLRDWRRNEPTKMDPRLLDLIWEVYQETGSRKHIHVVSGYRSPATNNLLRKRGRGVAKKSQHTLGRALDFFIPGVSLKKLRNIGLRKGLGGVGYYPKSGSPFVHMDTGRVRHWPRMSRSELVRVFPKGKTLHVPSDGKPLPGYNVAKARYERAVKGGRRIVVAKAEDIEKKPGLFAKLLGRGEDDEEGVSGAVSAPKPVRAKVVKPKPEVTTTTPEPAPAAKPEAPTPPVETPEAVLAALQPGQIPVPVLAPRITVAPPPTPELPATEVAALPGVPRPEADIGLTEQPEPEDAALTETAFAVPVPSQRPQASDPIGTILEEATEEPVEVQKPVQVAALSPLEIADLRKQVYAALADDNTPNEVPTSQPIPFKPPTKVAERNPFSPPSVLTDAEIAEAANAINNQIASVQAEAVATSSVPVPAPKPTAPKLVTALLPTQPDPTPSIRDRKSGPNSRKRMFNQLRYQYQSAPIGQQLL